MKVAEHFYSIQGEGRTVGIPAVFLRLTGCVLDCRWCDTAAVWRQRNDFTVEQLLALFTDRGYIDAIRRGAHLVLTGGDPLIQQAELASLFLPALHTVIGRDFFVEVETEGCIQPTPEFASWVQLWNVSPKLENSGMPEARRFKPGILRWHTNRSVAFKFPVENEADLAEVASIVAAIEAHPGTVYLMPVGATKAAQEDAAPAVVEWCKRKGWRFSPRLHLHIYDQATGV